MSRTPPGSGHSFSRRDMLRFTGMAGVAAAFSSSLAACGGPASTNATGDTAESITAVIGYGNNQTWDPLQTASAFSMAAILHSYESLVEGDPITREPYAGLAKELPADVSGTSLKFELRDGAKWHDGKPVTADDVVFTYARALDAKENVLVRTFLTPWLTEVKKIDDKTVEFVLAQPFPYALQRLQTVKICPKHVFEGGWDAAVSGTVVGSGPYKVVEQAPLSHTRFEKFADYNGPRPAVYKSMLWNSIVEASPRVAKISGAKPAAQIVENIPPANADQLAKDGRTVEFADGGNNLWLMFNTTHAPFDNKLVRQALHHAVDRDKMIEVGLKGKGSAGTSFINPKLPVSQEAANDLGYDPDKAKALLQQAGVTNLSVSLSTTNTTLVADCVNVIKEGWDAIGVATTLDTSDTKALFSKLDGGFDFQVVATTQNAEQFGNDPDLLIRYYYAGAGVVPKYAKWAGPDQEKLIGLLDGAASETDEDERDKLTKQVLDMLADQAVVYPLVFTQLGTAWDPKTLSGVRAQGYPGINLNQAKPGSGA
ncbi:ABC transporter substrate-binding protein [Actinophytocola algeriensis]|uniref:Peptide/nickel transport system substrate-binding protein n=1 Tax=Actinophytocola algeriensis TaxID=1768010 RepID=A0A7W7VCY0_9PSEU|nr:ABC transporter substrate-binding protein [Actinophytocola algeriensis]MBB4905415.1 peptide/nickel transport system substrate-binding protein [Actinophytocola algeriensis]MBE1472900.1 peptide/nickel transport system substrate-binding protein [Actinophytocola algeriensis]